MKYNYPIAHIIGLRNRALRLKFLLPDNFKSVPMPQLAAAYNGIGPDRWSIRCRKFMTWLLKFLEAPALVHDWQYTVGGNYWDFTKSNLYLMVNSFIEARDLRKIDLIFIGIAAAVLCQFFGWKGFKYGQ